jgi:DNA-directed RNA polymerase subunit K/omega
MSRYFDNQYGGEDDDNKFGGDGSDDESTSQTSSSDEELDEGEEGEEVEEEQGGGEDIEDDEEEENDEDDEEEENDEDQEGGDGSELEEGEIDEEAEAAEKKAKKIKKVPAKTVYKKPIDFVEDDEDDDDGEQYLQKFDQTINDNYIVNFHPESILQNYDEILSMTKVVRNSNGIIIDPLHRTIPYLTKYEKARILGQRAKQINSGAYPFVKVPENVIDGYIIAEMELKMKRIPFIIRRPLPNGGSEYWKIQDLEDISF